MLRIKLIIVGFFILILAINYSYANGNQPIKLYGSNDGFEVYSSGYEVRDIRGEKSFIHYFLLKNNTDKERELSIYPGFSMNDDIGNSYIKQLVYMRDGKYLQRYRRSDNVAPKGWIKAGVVIKGFNPKCIYFKVRYTFGYSGEYTFYKMFKNKEPKGISPDTSTAGITDKAGKEVKPTLSDKDITKQSGKKVVIDTLDFGIKENEFSQNFSIKNNTNQRQTVIISSNSYINDDLGNKFDSTSFYIDDNLISTINDMTVIVYPGEEKKIKVKINEFDPKCETFKARYAFKLPFDKNYNIMFKEYENK